MKYNEARIFLIIFNLFVIPILPNDTRVHIYYNAPTSFNDNDNSAHYSFNEATQVGMKIAPLLTNKMLNVSLGNKPSSYAHTDQSIQRIESYGNGSVTLYTAHQCHQIELMDQEKVSNQLELFQTIFDQESSESHEIDNELQQQRYLALQKPLSYEEQRLELTEQAQRVLRDLAISNHRFEYMFGNEGQRLLHKELVNILENATDFHKQARAVDVEEECKHVVLIADLGIDAAWNGDLVLGFQISDICSTVLNSLRDIQENIVSATHALKNYCYENPT